MKAALIDITTGRLVSDRERVDTPQPATPEHMKDAFGALTSRFDYTGPVGVGFPAVVRGGEVSTANNIDKSWIGENAIEVFASVVPGPLTVLNDADAAAVAESMFGAGKGVGGLVLVLTFGTGIGTGMLVDGELVRNVELGSMELDGYERAELYYAAKARKRDNLSWAEWTLRMNRYLSYVSSILSPTLMIVGGGMVKNWDEISQHVDPRLAVVPAQILNNAGIVGAAVATTRQIR